MRHNYHTKISIQLRCTFLRYSTASTTLFFNSFLGYKTKYFDKFDATIWRVIKDYGYLYKLGIDYNSGFNKIYITIILKVIDSE